MRIFLLLLLGLILQQAQAKPPLTKINPTGRVIALETTLRQGERVIGSVLLQIATDDSLSISAEGVELLLQDVIAAPALAKVMAAAEQDRLTQASFASANIGLQLKMSSLEVFLEIPEALLLDTILSLSDKTQTATLEQPSVVSGYINFLTGITNNLQDAEGQRATNTSQNHEVELGVRFYNTVLQMEGRYDKPNRDTPGAFFREGTRFIYDHPQSASRWVAGDVFAFGSFFQNSVDLLGIGITKNYTLIPTRNVRPTAGRRFSLQRASSVDMSIDGIVVRRFSLDAGNYDLRDIPLAAGSNDIELVIEDATGKVERIHFSVATDLNLLATGVSEFSLAGGIIANQGSKGPEYDYQRPVVSGFFHYGVKPWLTLGGNAQFTENAQQLGLDALFASKPGTFDISLTSSQIEDFGQGYAAALSFDARFGQNNPHNRRFSMRAEHLSANFSGIGVEPDRATDTVLSSSANTVDLSYGQEVLPQIRASLGLGYSRLRDPGDEQYALTASLSGPLFDLPVRWSLRAQTRQSSHSADDRSLFFSLQWSFSRAHRLTIEADSQENKLQGRYTYQQAVGLTGGISAFATANTREDNDASLEAGIEYTGNRFRAAIDQEFRMTELSGEDHERLSRLRFETSLAFAGKRFAIGRPVGDSFAILYPHSSLAEYKIRVDPRAQGDVVQSDRFGPVLIPDLGTYSLRSVNFEVDNLPPGYDLGAGLFTLAPPLGAGYQLQVGSNATITVLGTVTNASNGEPLGLVGGKAVHQEDKNFAPVAFFSNRKGRFAISGVKPGKYELQFATQPRRSLYLSIPEDAKAMHRVGTLKVQ